MGLGMSHGARGLTVGDGFRMLVRGIALCVRNVLIGGNGTAMGAGGARMGFHCLARGVRGQAMLQISCGSFFKLVGCYPGDVLLRLRSYIHVQEI